MLSLQVANGMILNAQAVADSLTPEAWREERRNRGDLDGPPPRPGNESGVARRATMPDWTLAHEAFGPVPALSPAGRLLPHQIGATGLANDAAASSSRSTFPSVPSIAIFSNATWAKAAWGSSSPPMTVPSPAMSPSRFPVSFSRKGRRRFKTEIRAFKRLNHKNICSIYDSSKWEGVLYYTMRFLEGGTLADRLKSEEPVSLEQSVDWVLTVAQAMDYAHSMGVVHRDLKPAN